MQKSVNKCVLNQVAMLPSMDYDGLKKIWDDYFDTPPQSRNKAFMVRKLAWRIQELKYGGLPNETRQQIKSLQKKEKIISRTRAVSLPPIGTMLVREHGGEEHKVMVLADCFEYRNCKYGSLSEIARKITGTRWSGPKFFGLKS